MKHIFSNKNTLL